MLLLEEAEKDGLRATNDIVVVRYSYATASLESGMPVMILSALLGTPLRP